MPALVVANAAVMRLIWAQGGVPSAINVLGVVNATNVAITQALTNTVGAAVKAAVASSGLNAGLGPTITLVSVGLRDIRSANQPEFLDSGAAVAGTGATDLLPPQTAFAITLRTASAGRRFRGRVYLYGFCEAFNSATGTALGTTAMVNFVTAIKSALTSSSLDLGVLSRPNPNAIPINNGFISPVTAVVARDSVWDTQRRRAVAGV